MESNQIDFWDNIWKTKELFSIEDYDFGEFSVFIDRIIKRNIIGKNILDLGCGRGEISVLLAKKGANVTSTDVSEEAINFAKKLAEYNKVRIDAYVIDALDIDEIKIKFDIVIGKYILHHIEPFDKFALVLKNTLLDGGGGVFYENNSRNKLLMLPRNHLVGKFGIPKYGDDEEHPFTPKEIDILIGSFREVNITYPKFLFFEMLAPYLFKSNKIAKSIFANIDKLIYKIRFLNKYSYVQIIEIEK